MEFDYELRSQVAIIRLNAPEKHNALSPDAVTELIRLLGQAERESRAILLGARGRAFCAGVKLRSNSVPDYGAAFNAGAMLETHINPLIKAMRDLKVPIITEVRGAAAGVGCSIALMGDIIIASDDAFFLQAFVNIGLVPDGGSTYILPRVIGRSRAMELMMLGERLPATDALGMGLLNRVVPLAELEEKSMEMAMRLANGPTKSLSLIRNLAWSSLDNTLDDQLQLERSEQRVAGQTQDFKEGVAAFFERRSANFQGH